VAGDALFVTVGLISVVAGRAWAVTHHSRPLIATELDDGLSQTPISFSPGTSRACEVPHVHARRAGRW
jgi:hypothetical protein